MADTPFGRYSLTMLGAFEQYSFRREKRRKGTLLRSIVKFLLIVFILYFAVTALLVVPFRVRSVSMTPGVMVNDRVLTSPLIYGIKLPLFLKGFKGFDKPKRGDLIVLTPPYYPQMHLMYRILDPLVRFFSLQQEYLHPETKGENLERHLIKRVIGVPGDTVRMENYYAYIKPENVESYQKETELITEEYQISTELDAPNWPGGLPFSGNMEALLLRENEYFVLGDNRVHSSDSKSWGAVPYSRITAKVFFRYWPIQRIGRL